MDKYNEFLNKLGLTPNMDFEKIEEVVGNYLVKYCLDVDYNPNEDGIICEEILDYIGTH